MWWFLAVLGLVLASWGIVSTQRLLSPERHPTPASNPPPHCSIHVVTAPDGVPFDVWVLEHPSPCARLLLCHGYFADRGQVTDLARCLRERGYEIILFELRGHGNHPGPYTLGIREAEDAVAILGWASGRDRAAPLPVGVLGFSMGAAVVCQAATRCKEVRAVVTDSLYPQFFPVLRQAIRERYHLPAVPWVWVTWWCAQVALRGRLAPRDPVRLAQHLQQPLLAIQGGEDHRVSPLLGRAFYEGWVGPKELWFEPDVGHVQMFARYPQDYCNRVAAFFDRTLQAVSK